MYLIILLGVLLLQIYGIEFYDEDKMHIERNIESKSKVSNTAINNPS